MPPKDKKDHIGVIESRVSYRTIAGLALWATKQKIPFANRSELLRVILDMFHDSLASAGKLTPVTTNEQAVEVLAALGIPFLTRGGTRNVIALSGSFKETGDEIADFIQSQQIAESARLASALLPVMQEEDNEEPDMPFVLSEEMKAVLLKNAMKDEDTE